MSYYYHGCCISTFSFLLFISFVHHLLYFPLFSLLPVLVHVTCPHHCLTALLYVYICACKCQLFTHEGSCRLPKRLN